VIDSSPELPRGHRLESLANKERLTTPRIVAMIGHKIWAIAEGYIPSRSASQSRELISHEAACMLNAGETKACVEITLYFEDRQPVGPYKIEIQPRRTLHMRFNDLTDPEPVPRDLSYSSVIRSNVPIVVQHTRLDSRNSRIALLSTMAFPVGEPASEPRIQPL
jgi:hypothetical protein